MLILFGKKAIEFGISYCGYIYLILCCEILGGNIDYISALDLYLTIEIKFENVN